jgi:hypothetical protein
MSSHRSQRTIDLHHQQVNASRARRQKKQESRWTNYINNSRQLRMEYNFMLVCGFICFAYIAIGIPVYLGYIGL